MRTQKPRCSAMIVAFLIAGSTVVAQSEPTAREQELADLVRQLSDRVEQLEGRIRELERGGVATPEDARIEEAQREAEAARAEAEQTRAQVDELNRRVEEIQRERPADVDPEEWKEIRDWFASATTLRSYWKDGLRFETRDGKVNLKIGGRIQYDWAYSEEDGDVERRNNVEFTDDSEFRRSRLYISGDIYENIEFKAQYDFAGGDSDFKDVFVGFKKVPHVGGLRIGHFKEPFSLEELTSSNDITFMERSLVNTFSPSRNAGFMLHAPILDDRMTWAVGVFRETDDGGEGFGGRDYSVTGRVTALPVYAEDGRKLVHLGVGISHRNFEDDEVRFRARPESHLAPRLVDTRGFDADFADLIGAEAAWVHGPFSLQGEYAHAIVRTGARRFSQHADFWAASVQASYFLTGEHRPYKRSSAKFDRVKPHRNFGEEDGIGAWELAARGSYVTLNDRNIDGGRLVDLTLGVNWYLNPNMRMMWNYVYADPSKGGDVSIFQWRVQLAF